MKALSEEKKEEVKRLRKQGMTQRQIAAIAGMSYGGRKLYTQTEITRAEQDM